MSKVEEVAGAMCNAAHDGGDGAARDWNSNQGIYRSMARAAIEAMREPSKEMTGAGLMVFNELDGVCSSEFVLNEVHKSMIDAALKETNP